MSISINFFNEDHTFSPKSKRNLRNWIKNTIEEEKYELSELNVIFCSDKYLLKVNQQYLNHDTYTDIITFDNSEEENKILGDIFISIERVKENAKTLKITFYDELHRIIVHGTLHLLGYKDKTKADREKMTKMEDYYLKKREF